MFTERNNGNIQKRLYREWLNNLSMYQQELEHLRQLLNQPAYKSLQPDASIELDALTELIQAEELVIESLSSEVVRRHENAVLKDNELNSQVMAFTEVIKNNQLREKIRKAEHSVFYLKYHVHKLLSLAS